MKILFSVLGTAGISLLSLTSANAVILVEPIVTRQNQDILNTRNPRVLGPEIQPGQVIKYGVPDFANNLRNGTGRDIQSLVFDLETLAYTNPNSTPVFNNELVQWGDVNGDGRIGFSNNSNLENIFTNVTIKDNLLTFSGGVIPDGSLFYNLFATQPNLAPGRGIIPPTAPLPADQDGPIRVSSYYTAIPETRSVLGIAVFGLFGVALTFKSQHKRLNYK